MSDNVRILDLNAFDTKSSAVPPDLPLARRLENAGASAVLFYNDPIELVSGEGSWVTAADGKRYLDVYNNVPSVGHCHPRVVSAVSGQLAKLNINARYLNARLDEYIDRLKATFPNAISNVVMTCSGSEANDLAMRVACETTGNTGFIVTDNAYHGNTAYVTTISPASLKRKKPPNEVVCIPPPDPRNYDGEDLSKAFAAEVEEAIKKLKKRGHGIAAFICDSIFSSDGIYADPPGFLKKAVKAVHKAGGLYIADEVQPGFARTGDAFWGYDRHGVTPDIITMGKPMGNGFPMAGMATRPDLLERLCNEIGYFNTFGGSPAAAAAGLAVLDVIKDEELQENARKMGRYLISELQTLAKSKPALGNIRGAGLFLGIDLLFDGKPNAKKTIAIINGLKQRGVLIGAAGKTASTLKMRPPLAFSQSEADFFLSALSDTL